MKITNTVKLSKIVTMTLTTVLSFTACTKKRAAELPESQKESIFAISEFGSLSDSSDSFTIQTSEELSRLGLAEKNLAINENGRFAVANADVPKRLKYMFYGLEISGKQNVKYPITFAVDRQNVTAYKIVKDQAELTVVEKQLAKTKEIIELKLKLQASTDIKTNKQILNQLTLAEKKKDEVLIGQGTKVNLLVPLFKYKVESFGRLQKIKNELKEDTSTLELKSSEWSQASHVQLSIHSTGRMDIGLSAENKEQLERIFVADKIDGQVMTAKQFTEQFTVSLDLEESSLLATEITEKGLLLYQITNTKDKKISSDLLNKIQSGLDTNYRSCSENIKKQVQKEMKNDCIMILVSSVPISFVKMSLPKIDSDGNESSELRVEAAGVHDGRVMVKIEKNAVADYKLDNSSQLNGDSLIRVSDLVGKEFFYRRTIQDAPYALGLITPGDSTEVFLVKFELLENRVTVTNLNEYLPYKNDKNDINKEELMSLPAKYYKRKIKTNSTKFDKNLELIETSARDAEFIQLAWNNNTLPMAQSPLSFMGFGQCLTAIGDKSVTDLDNRITKGVLSLSYSFSATSLSECLESYEEDYFYYGRTTETRQYNVRVKERISFLVNDHSTDKSSLPQLSFKVKHGLGVGNWTNLKVTPDNFGRVGGRAQKTHMSSGPDFSNGKVLKYTLLGLPIEDQERRKQIIEVVQKVISDWNSAYKIGLKGTAYERTGNYLELEIAGENGVEAKLGDLDKNIIYIENKFSNGNGGISLTGVNPRSGLTVSDLIIIHQSNIANWIKEEISDAQKLNDYYQNANQVGNQFLFNLTAQTQAFAKNTKPANVIELSPQEKRVLEEKSKAKQLGKVTKKQVYAILNKITQSKKLSNYRFVDDLTKTDSNYSWLMKINQEFLNNQKLSKNELKLLYLKELLNSKVKLDQSTRLIISKKINTINKRIEVSKYRESISKCKDGYNFQESNSTYAAMDLNLAFKNNLKYIIAHEIGHSQGLTHNFMGSFDKENMVLEKGNEKNYSSVMDYIAPSKINYNGIGTYDIHAIKAIQTGLIELSVPALEYVKNAKLSNLLIDSKFISFENLLKIYAAANNMKSLPDWEDVNLNALKTYVKNYRFCTDIDLGAIPNCRVWDSDVTFQEMLERDIQEYENTYILYYHHWDNSAYGNLEVYSAMFYTMTKLMEIRSYLDGFIMNTRANPYLNDSEVQDHITAVGNSMRFLISQVATPTTQLSSENDIPFKALEERFIKYQDSFNEKPILIQYKSDFPISKFADRTDGNDQYDTAGNIANRITALQLLIGSSKTDSESTRLGFNINYLDFEKEGLHIPTESSAIIHVLYSVIMDSSRPIAYNSNTGDLAVLFGMRQSSPNILRLIASMNALYGLENSVLKPTNNFANLFKIRRGTFNIPADNRFIFHTENDDANVKSDTIRYWTIGDSFVAENLLQKTNILKAYVKNMPAIKEAIKPIVNALIYEGQVRNQLRPAQIEGDVSTINQRKNEAKIKLLTILKDEKNGIIKALNTLQASENKRLMQNNKVDIDASLEFAIDYVNNSFDMATMVAKDQKNLPRQKLYRMFGLDLSSQSLINIFMMAALERFSEQESETKVSDEKLQAVLDSIPYYFANLTMIENLEDQLQSNKVIIDYISKMTSYTTPRE